jgi:hypothetical protein
MKNSLAKIILLICLVISLIFAAKYFNVQKLLIWVKSLGAWGHSS